MAKAKTSGQIDSQETMQLVRAKSATRIETMSPTFAVYYTNDIQLMMTPWDLRLRLGQLDMVDADQNKAYVTNLADVRLSPQHAKKLVAVMQQQLDHYEKHIGPIPQID